MAWEVLENYSNMTCKNPLLSIIFSCIVKRLTIPCAYHEQFLPRGCKQTTKQKSWKLCISQPLWTWSAQYVSRSMFSFFMWHLLSLHLYLTPEKSVSWQAQNPNLMVIEGTAPLPLSVSGVLTRAPDPRLARVIPRTQPELTRKRCRPGTAGATGKMGAPQKNCTRQQS